MKFIWNEQNKWELFDIEYELKKNRREKRGENDQKPISLSVCIKYTNTFGVMCPYQLCSSIFRI